MYTDNALIRAWTPSTMSERYFGFVMKSLYKKKSLMM